MQQLLTRYGKRCGIMAEFFEVMMMVLFGLGWPASILKSYRSRTARGKSIAFLFIIAVGYLCGILAKVAAGKVNYVVIFYVINTLAVLTDASLYFRNRRLDELAPVPVPETKAGQP